MWTIALLYCFFRKKENRSTLVYPFLLMMVVVVNPLSGAILMRFLDDGSFGRIAWCFMGSFLISFVAADFVCGLRENGKRVLAGLLIVMLLLVGGQWIYSEENFSLAENSYQVSETAIKIAHHIEERHRGSQIIIQGDIINEIRQYDPEIILVYGRYAPDSMRIENYLLGDHDALWEYFTNGPGKNAQSLVLPVNDEVWQDMYGYGWVKDTQIDDYYIYERIPEHWMWHQND